MAARKGNVEAELVKLGVAQCRVTNALSGVHAFEDMRKLENMSGPVPIDIILAPDGELAPPMAVAHVERDVDARSSVNF